MVKGSSTRQKLQNSKGYTESPEFSPFSGRRLSLTSSLKYNVFCTHILYRQTLASSHMPFYARTARFHLEKGQRLRAYQIIPFSWNFVFFHIFSVYQWCVQRHEYRVESIYGLYSYYGVVNCKWFNSGSEDTFREAVSFSLSQLGLSGECLRGSNLQQ